MPQQVRGNHRDIGHKNISSLFMRFCGRSWYVHSFVLLVGLNFRSCRRTCLDSQMPWTARMTKQNAEYLIESASRFAKKQARAQRGRRQRYCTRMRKEALKTFSPLPFPICVFTLSVCHCMHKSELSSLGLNLCGRREGLSCPSLMVSAWLGKPGKQSAVWNSAKTFATLDTALHDYSTLGPKRGVGAVKTTWAIPCSFRK